MTPEQYASSQYAIASGLAMYVEQITRLFVSPALTIREWLDLLRFMFPEVRRRHQESAELARRFYDSQRELHHPELPRNDRYLSDIRFDWFVENMEPARKEMSKADSPKAAVTKMVLSAVREVEMAGRRQIVNAVKEEPDPRVLQGWARVATGRETCAWCLMLISRGAEFPDDKNLLYYTANTAGLSLDEETALDAWEEAGGDLAAFKKATKKYIDKWHVGCDCIAVPVFDIRDWPGKAAAERALEMWADAGREASALIKSGEARTDDINTETLNALRRRLERGEINMQSYALAA